MVSSQYSHIAAAAAAALTILAASAAAPGVDAAASAVGWRVMNAPDGTEGKTGSMCIHNLLLPNDKLMCIERPHTHPFPFINPNTNGVTSVIISIDPNAGTISYAPNPVVYNAFCAGHSQAADGNVFVVGGDRQASSTLQDDSNNVANYSQTDTGTFLFNGIDRIRKFDLATSMWDETYQMTTARWYPTVVTMADGSLFIAGGDLKNLDFGNLADSNNPTYEFYPTRYAKSIRSSLLNWAFPHNMYPICFMLPSGKVFMMVSNKTVLIDPNVDPGTTEANTVSIADVPTLDHAPWIYPHTPTGFLLPMKESEGYKATVMICGGSMQTTFTASSACVSISPDDANAKWTVMNNMPHGRLMPDAALLPDGTVLVTNGMGWGQAGGNAGDVQYAAAPVFDTDLYDPVKNTWTTVGKSTVARSYHSAAVLLSDGSVITQGSEMANYLDYWGTDTAVGPTAAFINFSDPTTSAKPQCYPTNQTGVCTSPYEYRMEQFTPPYLAPGSVRPILVAPSNTTFTWGSLVGFQLSASGAAVSRITLVRYTTVTHSTNTDQRLLEPTLVFSNSTYVIFKMPPNGNVAPPGHWFVFALSASGVPSVAVTILLGSGPATSVTLPPGATVSPTSKSAAMGGPAAMVRATTGWAFGVVVALAAVVAAAVALL
ncbi:hypothetical protein DFJ73DRAFT_383784 [Zopfochytrium polystomum]|nr:hypothetical protein DFJ73DRAFT_383784 [Zopfochytrium polystomum]